ncbi:MAG: hypothetical protein Q9217_002257 [Psora testacea]
MVEFVSLLQSTFAREPPLIAREKQPERPAPAPQPDGAPPPIPPLPPELGRSNDVHQLRDRGNPPPPPPKPSEGHKETDSRYNKPNSSLPLSQLSNPAYVAQLPHANGHISPPLSSSQYDTQRTSHSYQLYMENYELGQAARQQGNWQSPRELRSPFSPFCAQSRPAPNTSNINDAQQSSYQQHQHLPVLSNQPQSGSPVSYTGPRSQHPQAPQQQQQQQYPSRAAQPHRPKPPEDLLTSPFETTLPARTNNVVPPPIPPNPQKDALISALSLTISQQIQSTYASNMSAIAPLRAQQAALTSTLNAINKEMSQLNDLEAMFASNKTILHQAMCDADGTLEEAKRREVPNVDDVLVAPTVVAGQLYQTVAEKRAIEDCRSVLGKALDKGKIGGGVWARQTRSLAREEFLKKTLIKKISRGMGLAEEGRWQ